MQGGGATHGRKAVRKMQARRKTWQAAGCVQAGEAKRGHGTRPWPAQGHGVRPGCTRVLPVEEGRSGEEGSFMKADLERGPAQTGYYALAPGLFARVHLYFCSSTRKGKDTAEWQRRGRPGRFGWKSKGRAAHGNSGTRLQPVTGTGRRDQGIRYPSCLTCRQSIPRPRACLAVHS